MREDLLQHAQALQACEAAVHLQQHLADLLAQQRLRQAADPELEGAGHLQLAKSALRHSRGRRQKSHSKNLICRRN